MMRVIPITCDELRNDGAALLNAYAAECQNPLIGAAMPDWDTYNKLQGAGVFQVFALLDGDDMAGFSTVLTAPLPHYSTPVATVESLFADSNRRGGRAFALLTHAIEQHAGTRGCSAILYSAPSGSRLEATLGKRYARTNSVFCKSLA